MDPISMSTAKQINKCFTNAAGIKNSQTRQDAVQGCLDRVNTQSAGGAKQQGPDGGHNPVNATQPTSPSNDPSSGSGGGQSDPASAPSDGGGSGDTTQQSAGDSDSGASSTG